MAEYEKIRGLLNSPAGAELKGFLLDNINRIKGIDSINHNLGVEEIGRRTLAHSLAYEYLKAILSEILTIEGSRSFEEKREETRKRVGL